MCDHAQKLGYSALKAKQVYVMGIVSECDVFTTMRCGDYVATAKAQQRLSI